MILSFIFSKSINYYYLKIFNFIIFLFIIGILREYDLIKCKEPKNFIFLLLFNEFYYPFIPFINEFDLLFLFTTKLFFMRLLFLFCILIQVHYIFIYISYFHFYILTTLISI